MQLQDSEGRAVRLGRELGRGGEGTVYELAENKALVAKLYHAPVSPAKAEKLREMADAASGPLLRVASWPVGTLHEPRQRPVRGILMPRILGGLDVHGLYSPAHRKSAFPAADWAFLVRAARNTAAAIATIHRAGHVVGDINQSNLVVADDARIMLIDCDSFQVRARGRLFDCEVGVPHYTPPELQARAFKGVVRTVNHDAFGLAVLVFHLLFMGRHPFAGRYEGREHMPIERAIREYRFAYGPRAATHRMSRPPRTLPLVAASPTLAYLFEQAFGEGSEREGARPTAHEWVRALDMVDREMKRCQRREGHVYHESLSACPWCALQKEGAPDFFASATSARRKERRKAAVSRWAEIQAATPPGMPERSRQKSRAVDAVRQTVPTPAPSNPKPTPRRQRETARAGVLGSGIPVWGAGLYVSLTAMMGMTVGVIGQAPLVALALCTASVLLGAGALALYPRARSRFLGTSATPASTAGGPGAYLAQEDPLERLIREARSQFDSLKDEIARLWEEYEGLEERMRIEVRALDDQRRELQLRRFLERHEVDTVQIPGIGPGRKATLASYGVETAGDVSGDALAEVPGMTPELNQALLVWRAQVESTFRFNPHAKVEPEDVAEVEERFDDRRRDIERRLVTGADLLLEIRQNAEARARALTREGMSTS